jgi:hypothetical protein
MMVNRTPAPVLVEWPWWHISETTCTSGTAMQKQHRKPAADSQAMLARGAIGQPSAPAFAGARAVTLRGARVIRAMSGTRMTRYAMPDHR